MDPRFLHGRPVAGQCGGQSPAVAPQPREAGRAKEKKTRRKARAKAGVEERPKAREKASHAACAEGLDTPRSCAPVKDGLVTWSRTCPKEKTPMRHSDWDTLAASLV